MTALEGYPCFIFKREPLKDKNDHNRCSELQTGKSRKLLNNRVERMANGALMIGDVIFALGIAKEGNAPGAAIHGGSSGKFILGGSPEIAGANDDQAIAIAVVFAADKFGVEQRCGLG